MQRKKLPYKALISKLLASKKLNANEQAAFEAMHQKLASGGDLTDHQKLWAESLRHRTDSAHSSS